MKFEGEKIMRKWSVQGTGKYTTVFLNLPNYEYWEINLDDNENFIVLYRSEPICSLPNLSAAKQYVIDRAVDILNVTMTQVNEDVDKLKLLIGEIKDMSTIGDDPFVEEKK